MEDLNLLDAWRYQHPRTKEFTSPNRSSRIDYVLLSATLCINQLREIEHDYANRYNNADHAGLSFQLGVQQFKPEGRAPWRCPEWVIKLPEAQDYLCESVQRLAASIQLKYVNGIVDPRFNPGCLLDEHKRQDSIFLRELFTLKKNDRHTEMAKLHLQINRLQHLRPSVASQEYQDLCDAQQNLQAMLEEDAMFA